MYVGKMYGREKKIEAAAEGLELRCPSTLNKP